MASQEQQPHGPPPVLIPVQKPISLMYVHWPRLPLSFANRSSPVGIKEAALDSPSFRATALHFSDQIEAVERWLDAFVKSASRLSQDASALESIVGNFVQYCRPPNHMSESVVDHDYTFLALRKLSEGAQDVWLRMLNGMKNTQASVADPIRAFLANELRPFKETRRLMEEGRKQFDNVLSRYAAQAKTKEPSSLREDAFQVHEARRFYLKSCMDFCCMAPQVQQALDTLLIKMASDQWADIRDTRQASTTPFGKNGIEMSRIRSWNQEMAQGEKVLRRELLMARREIEESVEKATRPSRDLEDYSTSTVPSLGTGPSDAAASFGSGPPPSSKQGWLHMRTLTGKPTRVLWVRKWFFVKNGIFGWLVQGARSGGVEESEKIGVLLCGIRPAAQEERRFCFEVKTKDSSIVLQAETQSDLSEWISVFSAAKQKAVEEPGTTDLLASNTSPTGDAAFAISPPIAPELAFKRADGQITTINEEISGSGLIPEGEGSVGMVPRASMDVNAMRKGVEREPESSRDHAARILQKLDIHRKTNAGPQMSSGPTSPPVAASGIGSLIAASHNAINVGPGRSASSQYPRMDSKFEQLRFTSTMAPSTLVNPPTQTNLTKTALTVGLDRGFDLGAVDSTGGMPSGLMANLWGSANHGHLSRLDRGEVESQQEKKSVPPSPQPQSRRSSDPQSAIESPSPLLVQQSNQSPTTTTQDGPQPRRHRKTISAADEAQAKRNFGGFSDYPGFYPTALRAHDAQFRMLFPNVPMDERVVLVFRASWNPDEQKDLPGRVYVTPSELYFYSHHFGMVMVTGASLETVAEVLVESSSSHDFILLRIVHADGSPQTTITLKTFLESPTLLQRRLNFLVSNCNSEDDVPVGLEAVLKTLVRLEKDDLYPTIEDLESFSEVAPSESMRPQATDPRMRLRVDRNPYIAEASSSMDGVNETARFRLPTQPVHYTPMNMTTLATEKVLDVSAKALLHIVFGDRSAVCPTIYQERRAQSIKVSPWVKTDEENHFSRTFDYDTGQYDMFWREKIVSVVDRQNIDVWNDHLCYMITDIKVPWHLPRPQDFKLISKIVITHEAKLRCRLAIYTKVEWVRRPWVSQAMIERRALDDLHLDAGNTADLIADQISRLGDNCNTRRAIDIFGPIGQRTEAAQFNSTDPSLFGHFRSKIRKQTLLGLITETAGSVGVSAASTILMSLVGIIRALIKNLSLHLILVVILLSSLSTNLWTSSDAAAIWFRERRTADFMSRLGVTPNPTMSKAVYLADLPKAYSQPNTSTSAYIPSTSKCSQTFQSILSQASLDDLTTPFSIYNSLLTEKSSSATLFRLHRAVQRLGTYRHDLLVSLRMINRIERETVRAEYESWLFGEVARCRQVGELLRARDGGGKEGAQAAADVMYEGESGRVLKWHDEYCGSCGEEWESVMSED